MIKQADDMLFKNGLGHGVFLAPMAGVTDHTYRTICKSFGAEFLVTEMISSKGVYFNDKKTARLARIEKGEISVKLNWNKQKKHVEGTNEFTTYKEGRKKNKHTSQSILTIDKQRTQYLMEKYAGKGEQKKVKGTNSVNVEFVETDCIVGKYFKNNEYYETKRFSIHYSKNGAHIVPIGPKGGNESG